MQRLVFKLLVTLLSAGWLIPCWLTGYVTISFFEAEILPALRGEPRVNSFPYMHFIEQTFTVTCIWLGLVVVFWAWRGSDFVRQRTDDR